MDNSVLVNENFSFLFEKDLLNEMATVARYKIVKKDEFLMDIGQEMTFMPLIISGAIKVFRTDNDGDDYILYFIEGGDTCAMTLNCCIKGAKSEIKAIAETDSELLLIPIHKLEDWLHFKSWRSFVFGSYNNRFSEMLEAVDSLAFMNMNARVLKYLKDKVLANKSEFLEITHNTISLELNTSRVVISRILKKLEIDNQIKLHRNQIEVINF
ncbi:MAG: Crp/Fnr family transcriptional regulator [Flavobacteriales bacterium]|jgi:CRP/FNR family transcriptional regulator, anaerobic regulatory protein|nr:Crp/Fnr family transcriptional regulator [Flavobacteriales bacterium]MDG1348623.1 Crp/Fnr family transcriptional regulator [Flavobacteriales bacterium]